MTETSAETFPWIETESRVLDFVRTHPRARLATDRLLADTEELIPPAILPIPATARTPDDYLEWCRGRSPGVVCVLLVRAGASALGVWRDDDLAAHKVFRRYVVRGHGKAQATHLASKGKSRYGSRLRLQNARRQLEETNERLVEWWSELGPFDLVCYSAPTRLWSDVCRAEPALPFAPQLAIPLRFHVHNPDHEELLRVRRRIGRGRRGPTG